MRRRAAPGTAAAAVGAALALLPGLAACGERPAPGAGPEEIYRVYCSRCHGADGRGDPRQREKSPGLDLLHSDLVATDRAAVRARIENGHGPMPGFRAKLEPVDLDRLTDFVQRLR